jgi:hypothetical protein
MTKTFNLDIANDDGIGAAVASLRDAVPAAKLTVREEVSASGWPNADIEVSDDDVTRFAAWYGMSVDEILEYVVE